MRDNGPVTNREVEVGDTTIIVSGTDVGGKITFANKDFIDISGYCEADLIGAPHNILRHPDMPPEAFADLWATVKSGRPWEGLVKNRTKSGDFYWVRANVTPMMAGGKVTGYISIRTKPARADIAEAERIYARFRAGTARGLAIREGRVVSATLSGRLGRWRDSVAGRLWMGLAVFDLLVLPAAGWPVLLVGVALSLVLGLWIMRTIHAPLVKMEAHFDAIAAGDLHYQIPPTGVSEFDRLVDCLRALKARIGYFVLERAEIARRNEMTLRNEMLALTEMLEGEVQETVGDISSQSQRLSEGATQLSEVARDLLDKVNDVAESVRITSGNVQTVAGATEELEASSREITARVDSSSELAETARAKADGASRVVAGLTEATAQIGAVVALIQGIAGQTRMLALNATIEAARAGEAGKGFCVVADEVKGLAGQTEQAIGAVSTQAARIGASTQEAVGTVHAVADAIRDIDAITAEVARAAAEQRAATAEIMTSAVQAADHTRAVSETVATMIAEARTTGDIALRVNDLSAMVSRDIAALKRRLYVILRTSYGGDRRAHPRVPAAVRATASLGGVALSGFTADLSPGGALLVVGGDHKAVRGGGWIDLDGVGRIAAEIVAESAAGLHLRFLDIDRDQIGVLQARIDAVIAADAPLADLAVSVAGQASARLEQAVRDGEISLDDLFECDYTLVAGTNPPQYLARHTDLAEQVFPPLIEPALTRNSRVTVCVVSDRNGYIAVHNRQSSHPQRPDDPVWNTSNSRHRRIYDDRTGILAARCTKPLVQTYCRDLGGGASILLKEMDAPVVVSGRRWGAVRLGTELR